MRPSRGPAPGPVPVPAVAVLAAAGPVEPDPRLAEVVVRAGAAVRRLGSLGGGLLQGVCAELRIR